MSNGKADYLQLTQEPICRMSTISAIFKGFAATIVAGIASITYCSISTGVLLLSFFPILSFAALDIYYLRLERKLRFLYEQVRTNAREIDFSMELPKTHEEIKAAKARICDCIRSPSIYLFYPVMIIILGIVVILKWKGCL